jgi:hypothetical protein
MPAGPKYADLVESCKEGAKTIKFLLATQSSLQLLERANTVEITSFEEAKLTSESSPKVM